MKSFRVKLFVAVLSVLAGATLVAAQQAKDTTAADSFGKQVAAISAGADNAARRAAIIKRLDQLGIKYRLETFTRGQRQGTNIVVELPRSEGRKELMLGAHYDRVAEGSGAVDNASGSAAVLELLAALKAEPLKNYALSAAFFDLEEVGLVGSAKHVQARQGKNLPTTFINFDVFGYGDTLWVGARDKNTGAAAIIEKVATANKFPIQIGPGYPPSDHLSFVTARIEALSFSLIDGTEIPGILKMFSGQQPDQVPRVMQIIHTPGDTMDKIDAVAVARALPVVEQAVRAIDAQP